MTLVSGASAFAFEEERNDIQKISYELFEDAKIKSYEYLYGFNDAPDFIYVDFENSGYAIYLRDNLELLEFSPKGNLPFPTNGARKYYGGPANYFNKESELFVNVVTRETLSLSAVDSETYSEQILELFSANGYEKEQDLYNESNDIRDKTRGFGDDSHMPEDDADLEDADLPGTAGTTYILNYQYFFNNPRHGSNATGTCAAVAAQLLLSYNNYYNDRRIIDDRHLNGWNFTTNSVTTPDKNPNHCTDPTSMTRETLGSNGTTESDINDTFFSYVVANIPASSSATDARNGLRNILNTRNNQIAGNINFNVDSHMAFFGLGTVDVNDVKSEINAGRPMYLSLRAANNGGHAVVAYGYQEKGSTTGYITHFGWSDTYNRVWANSAWCRGYVTVRINHTHNHDIDTGNIINNTHRELRCDVCGHKTVENLYDTTNIIPDEIGIGSLNYPLSGSITIPKLISGRTVTQIGNDVFADQEQLTHITIPNSVTTIGDDAFHCSTNVYWLDNYAFRDNIFLESLNERTEFIIPNIIAGKTITQISDSAFKNQTQLTKITIPSTVTHIGSYAFKNTNNASIYLEGRTSAPSTFNNDWNSSGNPVYLNGNLCTHQSTTLTKSNYAQHGQLCDDCRTFVSKENHRHNHDYVPYGTAPSGIAVHLSLCKCGDRVVTPCISRFPHEPGDTVTCWYCGQVFSNPILYTITLANGEVFVSNVPFTYEMYKELSSDLGLVYSYRSYLVELVQSKMLYLESHNNKTLILPYNIQNHEHGCNDCSNNCLECDKSYYECLDCNFVPYIDRKELLYIVENRKDYELE